MTTTDIPNWLCPSCENGYSGDGPSKANYAGDGVNPNLCRYLDKAEKAKGFHETRSKILRYWKYGEWGCPKFEQAKVKEVSG